MANELNLDLFKIDLSMVINKYIGETENNLSKVFDAAQSSGSILFFDEADLRLAFFIEYFLYRSTKFAVFEPNDELLVKS